MNDTIGKAVLRISNDKLASSNKTGSIKLLSTSALLALMEEACINALAPTCYSTKQASVSNLIEVSHIKPSPLGSTITAIAKIKDIDPKGIHFDIEAYDEEGLIANAKHTRVMVNQDDYERRCYDIPRRFF